MHRTPSQDDDEQEYSEASQQPRRRPYGAAKRPAAQDPGAYRTAENPQIPKVRRASLRLDLDEQSMLYDAEQDESMRRRSRRLRSEPTEPPFRQATGKTPVPPKSSAPLPRQTTGKTIVPPKSSAPLPRQTTGKTPVAPRGRPTQARGGVMPPLHRSKSPQQPTLITHIHDLSHNKPLLLLSALILAMLISLVPVLLTTLSSHNSSILNQPSSSGTSALLPPPNPHEIVITPNDTSHPPPSVYATSAYLVDADTGATLYAQNPFMHLPMMSTTKLMTALLAVEQGNLDQQVTITATLNQDIQRHLSADSSLFGIKQGETYTLRDLLYGLILPSGNDAAVAIADTIGGSYQHFVAMMNDRAQQLGMNDTHYMNPHGLLETGHYSSAHDLALIGTLTMKNSTLHQIAGTHIYHILKSAHHPERFVLNGNQFLWWYPGADGGKPGWDGGNNFVQVISSTRNNHHLVGVVMHTNDWWTDMRDLMNWGFNDFHWVSPYDVDFQHPIPYDNQWNYFSKDKKENTIPTADKGRYYPFTGFSITGPIMAYFDQAGGLNTFGFPTSLLDVSQTPLISQHFQKTTIQCDLTAHQCKKI